MPFSVTSTHSSIGGIGRKRTWEESFVALKAYKAVHGDCLVPIHTHYEDPALGGWVHHQRSKKDKLTADQRAKLESIGFVWRLRVRNKQWGEMLARLKKHHKNPDAKDDDELSKFVHEQRLKYARGQLSNARQKQLEAVGVVFGNGSSAAGNRDSDSDNESTSQHDDDEESTISYNDDFKQNYQQLVDFHIRHGHCRIPRAADNNSKEEEGEEEEVDKNALRSWVASLRRKYILNPRTGLDPKCVELLDDLNFEWYEAIAQEDPNEVEDDSAEEEEEEDSGSESSESEEEEEVASVKAEAVDADNDDDGSKLSDEESSSSSSSQGSDSDSDNSDDEDKEESQKQQPQVKKHKRQLLTKKRKLPTSLSSSLKALDNDHDSGDDDNSSGSSSISSSCSSNARRAKRLQRQNSRDIRFMKHYNDLLEFKRKFGHVRVPQSAEYKTLGGWVNNLRVVYKQNPKDGIRPDRLQLLNDAGFIWDASSDRPSNDARWEAQFDLLTEFQQKYGHCRCPQTGPHRKLGRWVATQRSLYAKDRVNGIREDRLQRLNDIGFTWDAREFKGKHFYAATQGGPDDDDENDEGMGDGDGENENGNDPSNGGSPKKRKRNSSSTPASVDVVKVENNDDDDTEIESDDDGQHAVAVIPDDGDGGATSKATPIGGSKVSGSSTSGTKNGSTKASTTPVGGWSSFDYSGDWDDQYKKLSKFREENGHCRCHWRVNRDLSRFIKAQRINKKVLSPDRIKLLNDLDFEWETTLNKEQQNNNVNDARWDQSFQELADFQKEHGHCLVPQNGNNKRLGKWVATQRVKHNKDPAYGLRPDRLKRLMQIGFTWNAKDCRFKRAPQSSAKSTDNTQSSATSTDLKVEEAGGSSSNNKNGDTSSNSNTKGTESNCVDASDMPPASAIEPLAAKLCDLLDQDFSDGKQGRLHECKLALERMFRETEERLKNTVTTADAADSARKAVKKGAATKKKPKAAKAGKTKGKAEAAGPVATKKSPDLAAPGATKKSPDSAASGATKKSPDSAASGATKKSPDPAAAKTPKSEHATEAAASGPTQSPKPAAALATKKSPKAAAKKPTNGATKEPSKSKDTKAAKTKPVASSQKASSSPPAKKKPKTTAAAKKVPDDDEEAKAPAKESVQQPVQQQAPMHNTLQQIPATNPFVSASYPPPHPAAGWPFAAAAQAASMAAFMPPGPLSMQGAAYLQGLANMQAAAMAQPPPPPPPSPALAAVAAAAASMPQHRQSKDPPGLSNGLLLLAQLTDSQMRREQGDQR